MKSKFLGPDLFAVTMRAHNFRGFNRAEALIKELAKLRADALKLRQKNEVRSHPLRSV